MSDEYTPTIGEIRERFIDGFPIDTWAVARDEEGGAFDRWLAQHEAAIRADQIAKDAAIAENEVIRRPVLSAGEDIAAEIRAQSPSPHEVTDDGPWEYAARSVLGRNVEKAMTEYHADSIAREYTQRWYLGCEWEPVRRRRASVWEPVPATTEGEKRA